MEKTLCIYHGNCADGFTAAWVVWLASQEMHGLDEVEFVPGVYGEAPIDVTDRHVIMVDFSYKRPILEEMIQAAKSVLILDHHKTAQADLAGLVPEGASTEEVRHEWKQIRSNPNPVKKVITGIFDMDRSGAQIAWDFFCPLADRPALVDYVGDRDLWRFDLERSQDISAYIFSHDYGFKAWSRLAEDLEECFVDCANEGEAITRKHWKDIRELLTVTRRDMVIGGHRVPVANLPYTMASDAAGFMAESAPFAACYFDRADGQRVFSLRSRGESGLDVSEIAASYGGGGHRNAAGFQMPLGWEGDETC